jgi:hypothetical protein
MNSQRKGILYRIVQTSGAVVFGILMIPIALFACLITLWGRLNDFMLSRIDKE